MLAQREYLNRLLLRLAPDDIARLGPIDRVRLELRQIVDTPDSPIEFVHFPEDALLSVVAEHSAKGSIEVGIIGCEGMTGLALVLGDDRSPFQTFAQGGGSALRVEAGRFEAALTSSPSLRSLLLRYVNVFATQVASTAAANGRGLLEERLARWLLMVEDRLGHNFQITHEFLSVMLAVRRSGVTLALQVLEGQGLIRSTRGNVEIIDRDGLIDRANGAYGLAEREYVRLLGAVA